MPLHPNQRSFVSFHLCSGGQFKQPLGQLQTAFAGCIPAPSWFLAPNRQAGSMLAGTRPLLDPQLRYARVSAANMGLSKKGVTPRGDICKPPRPQRSSLPAAREARPPAKHSPRLAWKLVGLLRRVLPNPRASVTRSSERGPKAPLSAQISHYDFSIEKQTNKKRIPMN